MVKTLPSVVCNRRIHAALQESTGNAILDNGADSTLLGSAFRMLEYSDRLASIVGFDHNLVIEDKKIGTGVAAFDKPDGETILVLCKEAIDHTSQDNTMLSSNQMKHNGIDVCDTHPRFAVGGRPGLFRIKVKEHVLPFRMENSLATLTFRRPTDDELETCDVIELTSPARWNPAFLTGDNFYQGADHDFYAKVPPMLTKPPRRKLQRYLKPLFKRMPRLR